MRALAAGLLVLVLAGCGGSSSDSAAEACQKQITEATGLPESEAVVSYCADADGRGLLDDQFSDEEANAVMRDHASLFVPICQRAARQGFGGLPAGALVGITPDAWGRSVCLTAIRGGYFTVKGFPPSSLERLVQDHPEIVVPFAVAGAASTYDSDPSAFPGMSRDEVLAGFTRVFTKLAHEGLIEISCPKPECYSIKRGPRYQQILNEEFGG
jgi:hypothetical protein